MSYGGGMSIIKWSGTILCLIGIALTSFNVYPLNILFGLVGSGLWTYAGVLQRDLPLILVEAVAVALYFAGVVTYINVRL
jgi:ABC-type microcin C transport system permease subunit YejB